MNKGPIRIAVVIPTYSFLGGAERYAAELTERLARRGNYHFDVFAYRSGVPPQDNVTFHPIPALPFPRFLRTPGFAWLVARRLAGVAPDLIHTHERIREADLFTLHGVPHDFWVRKVRQKRPSLYDRATIAVERQLVSHPRCRRFCALSGLTKEVFLQTYPLTAERIAIIPPGVDTPPISEEERRVCRREIRDRFNLDREVPLALFVSMNFEIKGLDVLLEGLAALKQRQPGAACHLIVAGKGNVGKYRGIAQALGIGALVHFTGVLTPEALRRAYLGADAYAMLSTFDTYGMVVLEAMAAGLPVLISSNVGARDLVIEGSNGFVLAPAAAPAAIADRLAALVSPDNQRAMSHHALETARNHSWEVVADRTEIIYEDILRERMADRKGRPGW
ncbi:MAG: glycosyltransferase family 4 protein [Smithellaceae bacterium]|nr:glycosyltransferase family 4 protein [Smithellaceae bacterium]